MHAGSVHELPKARGPNTADRRWIQGGFHHGQVLELVRHVMAFQGRLKNRVVVFAQRQDPFGQGFLANGVHFNEAPYIRIVPHWNGRLNLTHPKGNHRIRERWDVIGSIPVFVRNAW